MLLIEPSQHFHGAKFTVSDQENDSIMRQKCSHIVQQGQLLESTTMSTNMFDPCPSNWDGSFPICQRDHEQLMTRTDFCSIHNQTNFSQASPLGSQPLLGNRLIPFPYVHRRIAQKTTQTPGGAHQFRRTRDLERNLAQRD